MEIWLTAISLILVNTYYGFLAMKSKNNNKKLIGLIVLLLNVVYSYLSGNISITTIIIIFSFILSIFSSVKEEKILYSLAISAIPLILFNIIMQTL